MAKVATIGAGSIVFCQTLILGTPGLKFAIVRERLHCFDGASGLRFAA